MEEQRKAGKLAKGGGDKKSKHRVRKRPSDKPSLADQGVNKHLADQEGAGRQRTHTYPRRPKLGGSASDPPKEQTLAMASL
jgi:hypothetical protein